MPQKVIGLGFPRSGTKSLSAALEMLGLRIPHLCPVTGGDGIEDLLAILTASELTHWDGMVTSKCDLPSITAITRTFPDAYYIYTRRNEENRQISLHNIDLTRSVYEYAEPSAPLYLAEFTKRLLILDLELEGSEKWSLLCEFLGLDQPNDAYPHKNASEPNYVI